MISLNEYLTVKELSKWVKLSESHIYFLVNKKKIPFSKIGGKLIFDSEKIQEWINSSNNVEEIKPKKKYNKKGKESEPVEEITEQNTKLEETVSENPPKIEEDIINSPLD